MTVHFIGAGPGAADLITVRGRDLVARCPVCLYAGSIVPPELIALAPPGARVVDTAALNLDEIEAEFVRAHAAGEDIARLHSGDLSIYSALAEQLRRLERHGIPYTLTPACPPLPLRPPRSAPSLPCRRWHRASFLPACPAAPRRCRRARSLRPSRPPARRSRSISPFRSIDKIVAELTPFYGADCPAAVVVRASWPQELVLRGTLSDIAGKVADGTGRAHRAGAGRPRARGGRVS